MDEIKLLKRKRKAMNEGNNRLLINICADLSDFYMKSGEYSQAINEYKTLAEIYKSENNQIEYAKANRGIGEAYLGLNNHKKALEHQKIYLNIATSQNNDTEVQRAYATIGHIYLTTYLETQANPEENLNTAYKYFVRSMKVCEGLCGINKLEKADMQARLLSNLGLVKESLGDYNKAIELLNASIKICKSNDIYEQLSRGYMSLASLYDKKGDNGQTMHHYNLAIEAAKKLNGNVDLMCGALLIKSEALIKLGDFHAAKKSLHKAYKLNSPNIKERKIIENYLRSVATMCYTEDKLIIETNNNKELKKIYETMGDCACSVKNYFKALEYYKLMLSYAEKCGVSNGELSVCYNSLAQTYEDNRMYKEAVEYFEREYELLVDFKGKLDTLSKIADNKESANEPFEEIIKVYIKAIEHCRQNNNLKEQRRMICRCINYLERTNNKTEARKFEKQLNALKIPENEGDSSLSECESDASNSNCAKENSINLEDITDSDESEVEENPLNKPSLPLSKRRSKTFVVKKNEKGESQLHVACINNRLSVVKHLLEQGHPVNVRDNSGWLPIHEACNHGYYEIAKLLIDKGAAINDRGGVNCEGITPIYDAANNGHLEIVELLLDRGASVTIKTDNGDTSLNVLKRWHQKYSFEGDNYDLYKKIASRMTEAFKKVGENVNEEIIVHDSNSNGGNSDESNFADEVSSEKSEDDDCDQDSESGLGGDLPRVSSSHLNEYQEIMKNLRKNSNTIKHDKIRPVAAKKSLVRERELLEDWLEDDIQPTKTVKRRRTSLIEKSVNNKSPINSFPSKRLSDENRSFSVTSTSPSEPNSKRRSTPAVSNVKRKIQSVFEPGISNTLTVAKKKPVLTLERHRSLEHVSKQPKRTMFESSKSFIEVDSTPMTQIPVITESSANVSTDDLMVYVDVKINTKMFRVPVLLSQVRTNTIGWLADQAAQKYARKECSKPCLELETTSGALLSDEDPLGLLFPLGSTQAEPIVGRITQFYKIPLVDRYKETCSHMKEATNESLTRILEEVSVKLNLRNRGFSHVALLPLCKAINHQTTLLDLDLSGNFLDINCMTILCRSLPSLVNLISLNLRCTCLTINHLTEMVKMLSVAPEKILVKLKHLDLSNNYLRNSSFQHLAEILKYLKLEQLNVANVAFNGGVFNEIDNVDVNLDLRDIRHLNISDNRLSTTDIETFLSWTTIGKLIQLNVSKNTFGNTTLFRNLDKIKDNFLSLESLNLSRCKVQDNDVYEILRFCVGKSLVKIDLSYNPNLTGISLRRLLEHSTLEEINLIGCDGIFEYFPGYCEVDTQGGRKMKIKLSADFDVHGAQVDSLISNFKKLCMNPIVEKGNRILFINSKELES